MSETLFSIRILGGRHLELMSRKVVVQTGFFGGVLGVRDLRPGEQLGQNDCSSVDSSIGGEHVVKRYKLRLV